MLRWNACRERLQEELEEAEESLQAQRQMAQAYQTESESLKRQLQELQDTAAQASTLRAALQEVHICMQLPYTSFLRISKRFKEQRTTTNDYKYVCRLV